VAALHCFLKRNWKVWATASLDTPWIGLGRVKEIDEEENLIHYASGFVIEGHPSMLVTGI
jgi:hypothetical protein